MYLLYVIDRYLQYVKFYKSEHVANADTKYEAVLSVWDTIYTWLREAQPEPNLTFQQIKERGIQDRRSKIKNVLETQK